MNEATQIMLFCAGLLWLVTVIIVAKIVQRLHFGDRNNDRGNNR